MLRHRAKSELARLEYPDLLAGLYTPEELKDDGGMTCAECGKTALEQCWICGVPVCGSCGADAPMHIWRN